MWPIRQLLSPNLYFSLTGKEPAVFIAKTISGEMMFYLPTRIIFAEHAMQTAAEHIASLGRKALIVCGKTSAKTSGALDELLEVLQQSKMDWVEFAQVGENPDIHTVIRGKELLVKEVCDLVIAIGGGSPIDAAKAISLAAANDLKADEIYNVSLMHKAYPIIAIPTTAGTGSEVTQYSVLSIPEQKRKAGFGTDLAFPKLAILDPRYTLSLPEKVTLHTAIDALSHLLEGIYSVNRNPHLTLLIYRGIDNIIKYLSPCLKEPKHLLYRKSLMMASLYGGMTIAHSSTTLQHSIGYPLTSEFEIPHGLANGMVMQQIMDLYYPHLQTELDALFQYLKISREYFYAWLDGFPLAAQVPMPDEMLEAKIPEIMSSRNMANNPIDVGAEDIRRILKSLQKDQ